MIQSIARVLAVTAVCVTLGLHWVVFQSVAWTTMVVKFSQTSSLSQALEKTFDGNHPCSLCHALQKSKSSEKKSDLRPLTPKFDLIAGTCATRTIRSFQFVRYFSLGTSALQRVLSPPVPPPRLTSR